MDFVYPLAEYPAHKIPQLAYAITPSGSLRRKMGRSLAPVCAGCREPFHGRKWRWCAGCRAAGKNRVSIVYPETRPPSKQVAALLALACGTPATTIRRKWGKAPLARARRIARRGRSVPREALQKYRVDSTMWPDNLTTGEALRLFRASMCRAPAPAAVRDVMARHGYTGVTIHAKGYTTLWTRTLPPILSGERGKNT